MINVNLMLIQIEVFDKGFVKMIFVLKDVKNVFFKDSIIVLFLLKRNFFYWTFQLHLEA